MRDARLISSEHRLALVGGATPPSCMNLPSHFVRFGRKSDPGMTFARRAKISPTLRRFNGIVPVCNVEDMRTTELDNPENSPNFDSTSAHEDGWVRRTWGGWQRTLFILLIVLPFSSSPLVTLDNPSPLVSLSVGLLTFLATIAILFNPANPDRSAIAALAAFTAASVIVLFSGGGLALSLLFIYIVYEVSAYASRSARPWLAAWIFLGAAISILFNSNLVDHFSQEDEMFWGLTVREVKTIMSYAGSIVLTLIVTAIPWLFGKFMRGKRRAPAAS